MRRAALYCTVLSTATGPRATSSLSRKRNGYPATAVLVKCLSTKGGQKKKATSGDSDKAETEYLHKFFTISREAAKQKLNWSEEELAEHHAIGKEYNRQTSLRHNRNEKDITNKN